jgi:hypothetical protein
MALSSYNRGLASTDEGTKERVAKAGGEARKSTGLRRQLLVVYFTKFLFLSLNWWHHIDQIKLLISKTCKY